MWDDGDKIRRPEEVSSRYKTEGKSTMRTWGVSGHEESKGDGRSHRLTGVERRWRKLLCFVEMKGRK
jgi:hypothetical protein